MTVSIENEGGFRFEFKYRKLITDVVKTALKYENCPFDAAVEVVLTDDVRIREVNREFRNIDRATDVLSFPMVEYAAPADYEGIGDDETLFDPETGELLLGDIMISVEKAAAQAEAYGHSLKREIGFLTAHSMLHLLGYDHEDDEERLIMEKRQEEILALLGIHR